MKKIILVVFIGIVFSLNKKSKASDPFVWDFVGHFSIEQIGPGWYQVFCDPPNTVLCFRLIRDEQGHWSIISGPGGSGSPISEEQAIEPDYTFTDGGGIIFELSD